MRVGLVRHYKVKKEYPKNLFLPQDEIIQWQEEYDTADIEYGETDLCGIMWKRCFSSNLPRAVKTAKKIFSEEIQELKELREVRIYPVFKKNVRLPFILWSIIIRLAMLLSHKSQLETKKEIENRIKQVLDRILSESDEDVLIVTHGLLMMFIYRDLLRRGFSGTKINKPENGRLYVFEK